MYSLGKKHLRENVDLAPLEKAKLNLQVYLNELSRTQSLADNPEWVNAVTASVQKALADFEVSKKDLIKQAVGEEMVAFLQKANALDSTFDEIKVLLSQIFRVVTADAELKRKTLENINAELAK